MTLKELPLQAEIETYLANRQKWIDAGHEGEWVVVNANAALGFFPSLEEAYAGGWGRLALGTSSRSW